jgi:outer membrane autotransporter protein
MRPTLLAAALATASLAAAAAPTPAAAQDSGFYLGAGGGLNLLEDTDFGIAGPATVDNEYEAGFVLSGRAGYDTGTIWQLGGIRGELELSYRDNEIDTHSVAALGGSQPGSTGTASTTALMVNAFHDFDTGTGFAPYVGGGVGYAWSELGDYGIQAVPNVLDDSDSGFAWQLGAGVGYALTRNATISLDYRYFRTSAEVTTSPATGARSNDVDLGSHSILVGLRYRF